MKRLLLSLILVSFTMFLFATNVELQDAKTIAKNAYFQKLNNYVEAIDFDKVEIKDYYVINQNGESVVYAFNFKNYGFILIAADDAIEPVLGYTFDSHYTTENQPEGFKGLLWEYGDHVSYLRTNKIESTPEISQQWSSLSDFQPAKFSPVSKDDDIDPLLTATWNQDWPYNYYCPLDSDGPGGRVYVGCVSTAMCMIMQYWRYPEQGSGSHTYYDYPYGSFTVNFGEATYDWSGMTDNSDSYINLEMAEIGYHAAVAVEMNWGADGSGSYSADVPYALETYFGYDNSVEYKTRSGIPLTTWENWIMEQLEDDCPLYYSGQSPDGGHAFVLDGYRESDGLYHFNFGWSGSGNGYYLVTDAGGFPTQQGMVRNFIPGDADYPYFCNPDFEVTNFVGSFEDGSGPQEDYEEDADCSLLINPQTDQDSVDYIKLNFVLLDTEENDIVTIYDGASTSDPVLGTYSGSEVPSDYIYSTGNKMLITFVADGDGNTGKGFKAEYTTFAPSYCTGSATVITNPSGTLDDGSGDFYYANSTSCSWWIKPDWASDITLSFTEFNTEETADVVKIYDATNNQLLATYSGDLTDDLPEPIYNENGELFISFQSNQIINESGWTLEWEIGNTGIDSENVNFNSLKIYPNPTTNLLNVSFELEDTQGFEVKLISVTGNVVYQESKDSFSGNYVNTIDLSNMAKGVYFLNLSNDAGAINKKVVVK